MNFCTQHQFGIKCVYTVKSPTGSLSRTRMEPCPLLEGTNGKSPSSHYCLSAIDSENSSRMCCRCQDIRSVVEAYCPRLPVLW